MHNEEEEEEDRRDKDVGTLGQRTRRRMQGLTRGWWRLRKVKFYQDEEMEKEEVKEQEERLDVKGEEEEHDAY